MSVKVKPFAEHGHYTSVHDAVFDVVMPFCPPNAFKVLMFVLRKTRGWKKEEDVLRYAEIKAGTGIKSDATLAKELDWLRSKKLLIARSEDGGEHAKGDRRAPAYSLNRDFEVPSPTSENDGTERHPTSESEAPATSETEASNNQRSNNHSRRDADASLDAKKNGNWIGYFLKCRDVMGLDEWPEDRDPKRTPKHFKDLARTDNPTEEEWKRIVSTILQARSKGYALSPQKALTQVRSGNVHYLRSRDEPVRRSKKKAL